MTLPSTYSAPVSRDTKIPVLPVSGKLPKSIDIALLSIFDLFSSLITLLAKDSDFKESFAKFELFK